MSLPATLSEHTLGRLVAALDLHAAEDVPLTSPMSPAPVGRLRVLRPAAPPAGRTETAAAGPAGVPPATAAEVVKVVAVSLVVPPIGLDSHMIFAFTRPESAVPHFTLDAVASADYHAMHLDLIPRADLAVHLAYLDTCFVPLTEPLEAAWRLDGLSPAAVGPRQRAMMSPWMLVCRATEESFAKLGPTVDAYLDHWLRLLAAGVPQPGADPAGRDRANRANLFSPDVDPVWHQVTRLLGEEQAERVRGELLR
ncbi:hypothetical protein [Nonomuraea zeae]|uniref:Red chlorophyll catabolite reductase n=1 Tax=Nonomuraea zeae TaxID=1642303 RepID=A0A5S4GHS1_9ACTN|nr:hypothetical protein [Nonomuraea zeae]TMR32064.1 hypothetical protein ETD85_23755 [Nonomuraea zeae]